MARVGLTEDPDTPVQDIGTGKQQLVEICKAISKDVQLLILDEPTASLNDEESEKLLNLVLEFKKQGITSILISHKLRELTMVGDAITVLRDGETIETLYKEKEPFSEDQIIHAMVGRELVNRFPHRTAEIGAVSLEIRDWNVFSPLDESRQILKNINMVAHRGEVLGIAGLMGAGRTELAMSIFGRSYGSKISGQLIKDGKTLELKRVSDAIDAKIAYVSEDRHVYGIVIILGFGIATGGTLFRPMNISNIFMQNSYEIILAIGMFFCLTTGGNVDLSVGSVVAFAGAMMGALTLNSGMPTWQAVAITLVTGVLIGAMQGSFIAFLNVPPFIATLSGELVFRGLTQVVLQGQTLSPFSDGFKFFASGFVLRDVEVFGVNAVCLVCLILGTAAIIFSELKKRRSNKKYGFAQTSIFVSVAKCVFLIAVLAAILLSLSTHNGMPFILLVMAVLAIVYTFIANKTVLGRHVYMVGGNPKAAKLSGVRTDLVMLAVYTNMAFLSTIAGFVVAGRLNAASPKAGTGYELDAIAACTIGGAGSASGTIMGSIIGATVMAILNNGMSILGIGTDMQQVIKGCILLLAVTFDIYSKTKSKK